MQVGWVLLALLRMGVVIGKPLYKRPCHPPIPIPSWRTHPKRRLVAAEARARQSHEAQREAYRRECEVELEAERRRSQKLEVDCTSF